MPYPPQINREVIVQQARKMIDEEGVDRLSLHRLAKALDVTAPSLYRYVENKTAVLRAVNETTVADLFERLHQATDSNQQVDPQTQLLLLGVVYRQFAHENQTTYGLLFTNTIAELRPDEVVQEQRVLPLQAVIAEISGQENSLTALRGLFAFLHGWVMLEISQQFRRGGDLDAAFQDAMLAYLAGWQT